MASHRRSLFSVLCRSLSSGRLRHGGGQASVAVARYSTGSPSPSPNQKPISESSFRDLFARKEQPPSNPAVCRDRFAHLKNDDNGAEIFILASNYHPRKSPDKIPQLLEKVKPDVIALEICDKRLNYVVNGEPEPDITTLKHFYFFDTRTLYLQSVLRNTFLQLDEPLYQICKTAVSEAQRIGAKVAPIDIDIDTTVAEWEKALLAEDFITLSDRLEELPKKFEDFARIHSSIGEEKRIAYIPGEFPKLFCDALAFTCPHFAKVGIADRNEYMVKKLRGLEGKIVAIIGAAHLDGIVEGWKQSMI